MTTCTPDGTGIEKGEQSKKNKHNKSSINFQRGDTQPESENKLTTHITRHKI